MSGNGRIRTSGTGSFNPLLYQLSYISVVEHLGIEPSCCSSVQMKWPPLAAPCPMCVLEPVIGLEHTAFGLQNRSSTY